jgi:hypothetical protein
MSNPTSPEAVNSMFLSGHAVFVRENGPCPTFPGEFGRVYKVDAPDFYAEFSTGTGLIFNVTENNLTFRFGDCPDDYEVDAEEFSECGEWSNFRARQENLYASCMED